MKPDWSWWQRLTADERYSLTLAQSNARKHSIIADNHAAEAERIYRMGRERAGDR